MKIRSLAVVLVANILVATSVGVTAGAKVVPSDGQVGQAKVLVIGDSVFTAFNHVASARELLDSKQKTIKALPMEFNLHLRANESQFDFLVEALQNIFFHQNPVEAQLAVLIFSSG